MAKTKNLGLNLTTDEETSFGDWRETIDGNNGESEKSNMQIIDEEVGKIKNATAPNPNLINISEGEWGYVNLSGSIENTTGIYASNARGDKSSGFIPIKGNTAYTFQCWVDLSSDGSVWQGWVFYDSEKMMVGSRGVNTATDGIEGGITHASVTFTTPEGASYVRVSARTYFAGKLKLEEGEVGTAYVAHIAEMCDELDMNYEMNKSLRYAVVCPPQQGYPKINTADKTLVIPSSFELICPDIGSGYKSVPSQTLSFSDITSSAVCIVYNLKTEAVEARYESEIRVNNFIHLFTIRAGTSDDSIKWSVTGCMPCYIDGKLFGSVDVESANSSRSKNPYIKNISHRGFSSAPENTLLAFKESKKKGFEYVECDIRFTSDGIPVLLHDASINRTARNADGSAISETKNIADITYEEASSYDFGIYKDSKYAGEKIPTLAEFARLCKQLGLKPYIELKVEIAESQWETIAESIKRYGIQDNCTFLCGGDAIEFVRETFPKARIGIVSNIYYPSHANKLVELRSSGCDAFYDLTYSAITEEVVNSCIAVGLPLETWTTDTTAVIVGVDNYVSGYTSNKFIASSVLVDEYI